MHRYMYVYTSICIDMYTGVLCTKHRYMMVYVCLYNPVCTCMMRNTKTKRKRRKGDRKSKRETEDKTQNNLAYSSGRFPVINSAGVYVLPQYDALKLGISEA